MFRQLSFNAVAFLSNTRRPLPTAVAVAAMVAVMVAVMVASEAAVDVAVLIVANVVAAASGEMIVIRAPRRKMSRSG